MVDTDQTTTSRKREEKSKRIAQLGSILLPGFGYIYTGRVAEGIFWSFLVALTYIFIVGILMHGYLVWRAAQLVEYYNEGHERLVYKDIDDNLVVA